MYYLVSTDDKMIIKCLNMDMSTNSEKHVWAKVRQGERERCCKFITALYLREREREERDTNDCSKFTLRFGCIAVVDRTQPSCGMCIVIPFPSQVCPPPQARLKHFCRT